MIHRPGTASTGVSRLIGAEPEAVYAALTDPDALAQWLPPAPMRGRIEAFDGRVGGGYRMVLCYPPDQRAHRGKSCELEDRVRVRFVELDPPRRIAQTVGFESPDPAFAGEMTMVWALEAAAGGTKVTVTSANLPPGLKAEDNDEGARISLEQLARRLETGPFP